MYKKLFNLHFKVKKYIFSILVYSISCSLLAQDGYDIFLARQFVEQKEYSKAIEYYNKVLIDDNAYQDYYEEYKAVLLLVKDYKNAEKLIKKVYLLSGKNSIYWIDLGDLYALQNDEKNKEKYYQKALDELPASPYLISDLANFLIEKKEYDFAAQVYKKGKTLLKNPSAFNLEMAYIYGIKNDIPNMIEGYLNEAYFQPENIELIKNGFQRVLHNDQEFDQLETALLTRLAKDKSIYIYQDILVWLYMQRNDFESALIQSKSLDMIRQEDGMNIINLARAAASQKDYVTAIKAYKYVIAKGSKNPYFLSSNLELINATRDQLFSSSKYTKEQLYAIKRDYLNFFTLNNNIYTSTSIALDYAEFQALYLHEADSAIATLEKYIDIAGVNKELNAKAKLALGDYYLMAEQPWESLLLYTQVEKDFKNTVIGEESKYRNARLAFYKGDFEWAQTQLRIIKANTPELISNDAIDLSVFIMDNLNQDTLGETLFAYAKADLLRYQNKMDDALVAFNQILLDYPLNPLTDDIYFSLYKILRAKQEYASAGKELEKIIEAYADEILGDNATFYLAELNELFLDNKEQAKTLYEKVIIDYTDSTFGVEARKRYRILRGDVLEN